MKTENGAETVYTYNALNQLTAENDITYAYDAAGNLISAASPTKSTLYVYNAENKLIRATVQEGNEVSVEEYEYDYAGNRTVKKSEGEYTYYLNDISGSLTQVLAEIDADGNEKCWYTRGIELISQERSGVVSYYLTDGHGSVRQLADTAGTVTDTYVYDAWGNLISSTGETENSYLYCGEQLDSTTGLYYLRARYMNPTTGTFISMDTYQGTIFDPTSLHKYLYANANPVMNVDPSGNMAQAAMMKAEAQHNALALVTYHKLMATLKTVCATHVKSNLVNIVAGTLAVSVLGKASQMLNDLIVISAASGFTIGQSKNANVYSIASWMVGLLLTAAQDVKNSGRNINLPKVIHHIVQQKFWFAKPAQAVLIESGVNPCIGYTTSQLRAAEKLGEPNLTEIKALTHFAIHSQLCNTPYTAWVNLIIVATPHHSDVGLANYLAVASSLALIEGTIKSVDAIL